MLQNMCMATSGEKQKKMSRQINKKSELDTKGEYNLQPRSPF